MLDTAKQHPQLFIREFVVKAFAAKIAKDLPPPSRSMKSEVIEAMRRMRVLGKLSRADGRWVVP